MGTGRSAIKTGAPQAARIDRALCRGRVAASTLGRRKFAPEQFQVGQQLGAGRGDCGAARDDQGIDGRKLRAVAAEAFAHQALEPVALYRQFRDTARHRQAQPGGGVCGSAVFGAEVAAADAAAAEGLDGDHVSGKGARAL